tara:strand:+ start:5779 stop:7575 length:1797 start_codon:yes stop_codon:yes gene_type:complete
MAEKIVSPGVFTRERDLTFLPAGIQNIGAAIVGPTVKGPAGVPTMVTSFAEYRQLFGDVFESGSGAYKGYYSYLTSLAAEEYLRHHDSLTVVRIMAGSYGGANSNVANTVTGSTTSPSFKLHTLSDGALLNSGTPAAALVGSGSAAASDVSTNNILVSGSKDNLRWEIASKNISRGTFALYLRSGNDTIKRKNILETWNNLSLDPNSTNYIAKRLGDAKLNLKGSGTVSPYIQASGSYANKSKYVRVEVLQQTLNYLDENGNISSNAYTASLPMATSGTFFGGSDGTVQHPQSFYENITSTNSQGYNMNTGNQGKTAYEDAINLLRNSDEYDINLLMLPGVISALAGHSTVAATAIQMCEDRGDCFTIIDPVAFASSITDATTEASARDTNYAAVYWPWVQMSDNYASKNVWVPASVAMGGVYAFNDKVAAEWFAPAGLNRGGIDRAIQPERKLTHGNRDTLYDSNVNPLATFPNSGVVAFGQKTLQKKASALDRVNVRRLLIAAKKFIASSTRYLVFEQNTSETRNRFLSIVNPYLESVQQRQGLYAFKVVMDESNNTPDVIDRNQMVGQLFLQPTRTAEFIIIDFNILPTGAAFPE